MSQEQKYLSIDVVKRFMNDGEFGLFIENYTKSKFRQGNYIGKNRKETLALPLTTKDREILKAYFEETDTTLTQLSEQYRCNVRLIATYAAARFLYQHPEFLRELE